jgi:hypothetical protein
MTRKKSLNYNQTAFKVGASPQPADDVNTEREKEKVTRSKAAAGGDEEIARDMGQGRKE